MVKSGKLTRRRRRKHLQPLLFALALAYAEKNGIAPSRIVTRRAAEIETGYNDDSGRRTIRNALYDLVDQSPTSYLELVKEGLGGQLVTGIRFMRRAGETERQRRFNYLLDEHKVGHAGGPSFGEIAEIAGVDERSVRRWAKGEQSVRPNHVIRLISALNPDGIIDVQAAVLVACEPLALIDQFVDLGLSPDEVWRACQTAHGARLKRMGISKLDVQEYLGLIPVMRKLLSNIQKLERIVKDSQQSTSSRQRALSGRNATAELISRKRNDNNVLRTCEQRTRKLLEGVHT